MTLKIEGKDNGGSTEDEISVWLTNDKYLAVMAKIYKALSEANLFDYEQEESK